MKPSSVDITYLFISWEDKIFEVLLHLEQCNKWSNKKGTVIVVQIKDPILNNST